MNEVKEIFALLMGMMVGLVELSYGINQIYSWMILIFGGAWMGTW